jgi:hypothetical protein
MAIFTSLAEAQNSTFMDMVEWRLTIRQSQSHRESFEKGRTSNAKPMLDHLTGYLGWTGLAYTTIEAKHV